MAKIKIISNPYNREVIYQSYKEQIGTWEDIKNSNTDSRLREDKTEKAFLPFKIKEIVDIIIDEYYVNGEKVEIFFEGIEDEYIELQAICRKKEIHDKVQLSRTSTILENARSIFDAIKEKFYKVQPIIENLIRDDLEIKKDLNKVSDAMKDIIPICVFGNYSAGKSTFINALIGSEVLPSSGDPVTAKVYKIKCSKEDNIAKIKFSYKEELFEILFEGSNFRVIPRDVSNELINDIVVSINASKNREMTSNINIALQLINGCEKKNKDSIVLSNVIELEIPFSKNGVLGKSDNNFVIFDTPGSNSKSNIEHSKVLSEALEGFSNGIPVWISTYESLDSTDNASLCDKILDIKALDKRFTMIVLNKADGSGLDEGGFSKEREHEILEYSSVEKMYANGIYFVSSIMGIGAKNQGSLKDKNYRKIYRSQQDMYSNPDDEDYVTLYKYNIMPEQIKQNVMTYSMNCSNLIYANSGLYCVEKEIDNFASKYAAYNKCQMVYMFLKNVIEETDKRITSRTKSLKRTREARKRELETAKEQLIDNLNKKAQTSKYDYDRSSKAVIKSYVTDNLNYSHSVEELERRSEEIKKENMEKINFSFHKKGYEDSKNSILFHLKDNCQNLKKNGLFNSLKTMKDDFSKDYTIMKENRNEINKLGKEVDKETSNRLVNIMNKEYSENIIAANNELSISVKEYWQSSAHAIRKELVEIVTDSDGISLSKREELSNIIINYKSLEFNDDVNNVFDKSEYSKKYFLGIKISDSEELNIKKLTNDYNYKIKKDINDISIDYNQKCYESFINWEENLLEVIKKNIIEYNPQLRDMSDMIREETEKITELEDSQKIITASLNDIEALISWKEL